MILPALVRVQGHSFFPGLLSAKGWIYDLGANAGHFSRTVLEMFGSNCVAVEANPSLAAELQRTQPQLQVIHAAVWKTNSQIEFTVAHHPEFSSVLALSKEQRSYTALVPGLSLEQIVGTANASGPIDLVKMDIEGAETAVLLEAPDEVLRMIGQITVEFHESQGLSSKEDLEAVFAKLARAGFDRHRFSLRHHGDTLFVNHMLHPRPHRRARAMAVLGAQFGLIGARLWAKTARLARLRR